MKYNVIPFFKSQFSVGRSILTLEGPAKTKEGDKAKQQPDSIFDILKEEKMDEFCLVDDSPSGYLQAQSNADKFKKKLVFGVRLTHLDDATKKEESSQARESKIIILCHNKKGYQELVKIWSMASQQGFYYIPRIDDAMLAKVDTSNLSLVVPFYDSFLYRNNFECSSCLPSYMSAFKSPVFALEDNDMPFDRLLTSLVTSYAADHGFETMKIKSIYYKKRKDFIPYLTFRCIHNRTLLSKPNLDHMCSEEFSFESWKEQNEKI